MHEHERTRITRLAWLTDNRYAYRVQQAISIYYIYPFDRLQQHSDTRRNIVNARGVPSSVIIPMPIPFWLFFFPTVVLSNSCTHTSRTPIHNTKTSYAKQKRDVVLFRNVQFSGESEETECPVHCFNFRKFEISKLEFCIRKHLALSCV